jgi:membrane protein DedA with SNARE-associated domain
MVHDLVMRLVEVIGASGYGGIFLLMAMESSIIPVPSELVMPPAGYLAFQGQMSMAGVILAGTLGSLVGAYANYFTARHLGRPLVLRYGRYVLVPPEKFLRVESFFLRHGEISTFIGRLLPVIRHLVSIPAGLSGMNHLRFSAYTLLGAGIWCTVLAWIGYTIGANQALVLVVAKKAVWWVVAASALLAVAYALWHRRRSRGAVAGEAGAGGGE